jgi:hypothetical protein
VGWMDWLEADPQGWLDLYLGEGMFRRRDAALVARARALAAAVPADGSPNFIWQAIEAASAGHRVVAADAGHALFVDQPQVCNHELCRLRDGLA